MAQRGSAWRTTSPRGLPCRHAAIEDVERFLACRSQLGVGLGRPPTGLADQHHRVLDVRQIPHVFPEGVQRHVVGPRDVHGLEFAAGPNVEDANAGVGDAQLLELGGIDEVGVER